MAHPTDHDPAFRPGLATGPGLGARVLLVTDPASSDLELALQSRLRELAPELDLRTIARSDFLADPATDQIDTILVAATALGRCALVPLNRAFARLPPGGILGLVAAPPQSGGDSLDVGAGVPWRHLLDQARYCGFMPVPDAVLDLGPAPGGAGVAKVLTLLRRAETPPRWRIAPLDVADAPRMRALFAEVFAPHQMSPEHWQWKYGDGRGAGMGAWAGDELVAFYGGVWRSIVNAGVSATAVQITDVMVARGARGLMRREGAFFLTAASFLECYIGEGARALLGFGFPTERAYRTAALRRLYGQVDRMLVLEWPPLDEVSPRARLELTETHLEPIDPPALGRECGRVDRLWDAMRHSLPDSILGVRDWDYVAHRYLAHPHRQYRYAVLTAAVTRQWLSLAVLAPEQEGLHLRDTVGDIGHLGVLIDHLRRADAWRGQPLKTWITASHAGWLPLREDGTGHDLGILIPHCAWTPGPALSAVAGRWWLTGGDTDFL